MKNGVGRQHAGFTPWFWSYRLAAKIEAVVVVCVIAGVIAILALLFRMPGPLVVHLQDEKKDPKDKKPDGASENLLPKGMLTTSPVLPLGQGSTAESRKRCERRESGG